MLRSSRWFLLFVVSTLSLGAWSCAKTDGPPLGPERTDGADTGRTEGPRDVRSGEDSFSDPGSDAGGDDAAADGGSEVEEGGDVSVQDTDLGDREDASSDLGDDGSDATSCADGATRACGEGTGVCQKGVQTCRNGTWGACKSSIGPTSETCDRRDNDCDGDIDEGLDCQCNSGQTRPCGTSTGRCQTGTQQCNAGQWGRCQGGKRRSAETCNGEDDDCDGTVDEGAGCNCQSGQSRPCGTSKGICQKGTQRCTSGTWGTCEGETSPEARETCDSRDNDCDGATDEGLVQTCGTSTGRCETGTLTCTNGAWGNCRGNTAARSETCNNKDDDCDGSTDEGLSCSCQSGQTRTCGTSEGICTTGQQTCNGGTWSNCQGNTEPKSSESCNGKDDDCDGSIDEDLGGQQTTCGTGACQRTGQRVCRNGQFEDTCTPGSASQESCNGVDDDCDGSIDEGLQRTCGQSTGQCSTGTTTCNSGSWSSCQGNTGPSPETCNGLDDDCDGSTDENLTDSCSNQAGVCAGSTASCQNGSYPTCDAGNYGNDYASFETTCDNRDNDCDGTTDETCSQWADLVGGSKKNVISDVTATASAIYAVGNTRESIGNESHSGGEDLLLVKYDTSGTRQWVRLLGSSGDDRGYAVEADGQGNVYVAGYSASNKIHGETMPGVWGALVAKYDASGSRKWVRGLGGSGHDLARGLEAFGSVAILVTGYSNSNKYEGQTNPGKFTGFFTAVFDDGGVSGSEMIGTSNPDRLYDIVQGPNGKYYMAGWTKGAPTNQNNSGKRDAFLVKYNTGNGGQIVWTRVFGSSDSDRLNTLTVGGNGIWVAGGAQGSFGGQSHAGGDDAFFAEFTLNGQRTGVELFGGGRADRVEDISYRSNRIYLAGTSNSSLFGDSNAGSSDAMLAVYDTNAKRQWGHLYGTPGRDEAGGVGISSSGLFIGGRAEGNLFGQSSSGNGDAFTTRITLP